MTIRELPQFCHDRNGKCCEYDGKDWHLCEQGDLCTRFVAKFGENPGHAYNRKQGNPTPQKRR